MLHTKWSNLQNTQQGPTRFSAMSEEDHKMMQEKFYSTILKRDREN